MKFVLKPAAALEILGVPREEFPKYTTQLLNLANQDAQGTRPRVVGQLSDLIASTQPQTFRDWCDAYAAARPTGLQDATARVLAMIRLFEQAIAGIDRAMVERWVADLVLAKTFVGFMRQDAIMADLAVRLAVEFRPATAEDEAQGIDGWLHNLPVQVKPASYRTMAALPEHVACAVVYYADEAGGVVVDATEFVTRLEQERET